jgi:hypothetical protein
MVLRLRYRAVMALQVGDGQRVPAFQQASSPTETFTI